MGGGQSASKRFGKLVELDRQAGKGVVTRDDVWLLQRGGDEYPANAALYVLAGLLV